MENINRLALVTGASRGIGRAIMLELANIQGLSVVGTATSDSGVASINDYCCEHGLSNVAASVLQLNDIDTINATLRFCDERFGLVPQILVNNAGVTADNLALRMSDSDWLKVIDTNLTGVFRLTQAALKPMLKTRWGRIINIGSVVGSTGNAGQINYSAAKSGLIGFSKSLALEVAARNITVNIVSPGFIETDMTEVLTAEQKQGILNKIPMKQMGKPQDIAKAVKFLISDSASYITGLDMHVNGGMLMN